MKKVLFASTIIAGFGFAGAASAIDLKVDGYYTNGFIFMDQEDSVTTGDDVQTIQDFEFEIKGSEELDNGLTVYADIEVDSTSSGNNARFDDVTAGIKGSFGDFRMGNFASDEMVDGLVPRNNGHIMEDKTVSIEEADIDEVYNSDFTSVGYKSPSFSGFSVAASYADMNGENGATLEGPQTGSEAFAVGAGYSGSFGEVGVKVGIAYHAIPSTDNNEILLGASVSASGFTVQAAYGDKELGTGNDETFMGGSVSYATGPFTFTGAYAEQEEDYTNGNDRSNYYVKADYAIGGGVTASAAYGGAEEGNLSANHGSVFLTFNF
ncbi:MAG TPA: hypothetical protein DIT98_02225 [Verrucomicrobiales bacterium]|nr:hypothetical protein [Verrucomicrobiales bacterium]